MQEVIVTVLSGCSGLPKKALANTIKLSLPSNTVIVSTSDIREIMRVEENKTKEFTVLQYSTTEAKNKEIAPIELLKKQSLLLRKNIESVVKKNLDKGQNVIVVGTCILPGEYNFGKDVETKHIVLYSENIAKDLSRGNRHEQSKLENLDVVKLQQEYILKLAEEISNCEIMKLSVENLALEIARKINQIPYEELVDKIQNIDFVINGVTCCGKTTISSVLANVLTNTFESYSRSSTDDVREVLRNLIPSDVLNVSTNQLIDVEAQKEIMAPYIRNVIKRNREIGSSVILEGVGVSVDEPNVMNILLILSKEELINRISHSNRTELKKQEKLETISNIMEQQDRLILKAIENDWIIIENNLLPEQTVTKILEATRLRVQSKNIKNNRV